MYCNVPSHPPEDLRTYGFILCNILFDYFDSSDIGLNSNPEPPEEMWEGVRSTE